MKVIREMEEEQSHLDKSPRLVTKQADKVKEAVKPARRSTKKRNKNDVSQDSIDYTLSSSEDEDEPKVATPALSRVSEAKTDVTKPHVLEPGGIAHEESYRLETRSDLTSVKKEAEPSAPPKVPAQGLITPPRETPRPPSPKKEEGLAADDISFASSSSFDNSVKNLDLHSILKHRNVKSKG